MSQKVLDIFWPGLGDALAFSTLPEEFQTQLGFSTFLSNRYLPRNQEIVDLVWGHNPFIAGWTGMRGNSGNSTSLHYSEKLSFIENVELSHGLSPRNKRPKIYYSPRYRPETENCTLVDLHAVTNSRGPNSIQLHVLENILSNKLKSDSNLKLLLVNFESERVSKSLPTSFLPQIPRFVVSSIFEYVDAMASASSLIGLHSGSISLGAAVKSFNEGLQLDCFVNERLFNAPVFKLNRMHVYPDVRYLCLSST